jgi:hypothetical protein
MEEERSAGHGLARQCEEEEEEWCGSFLEEGKEGGGDGEEDDGALVAIYGGMPQPDAE